MSAMILLLSTQRQEKESTGQNGQDEQFGIISTKSKLSLT